MFLLLCATLFSIGFAAYSQTQSNISAELSAAAYCGKDRYTTIPFIGAAEGFVVTEVITDTVTDLEGFIGILPAQQTIYVVFRGSSSLRNWIEDLEVAQVGYDSQPECAGCKVHHGFYRSTLRVMDKVLKTTLVLHAKYQYDVVFTGHSYGAAVTQLLAMELTSLDIYPAVYNFGQPRIGNAKYAAFVNEKLKNVWRVTHDRDIVPHIPPQKVLDYLHSCGEVFEDAVGKIRQCSETQCEDMMCSEQYRIKNTDVKDHMVYLGRQMDCVV